MRLLYVLIFVSSLLACTSNDNAVCPEGQMSCGESCIAPGGSCSPVDGGNDDLRKGDASLSALTVSPGQLDPSFMPDITLYNVRVAPWISGVQVTATAKDPSATLLINGVQVTSGTPSPTIPLGSAVTMIAVSVRGRGGAMQSYSLVLMRSQGSFEYLKASNTNSYDFFGRVSLFGDTLAVGAVGESSKATGVNGDQSDNSAMSSGAIYVFRWSGATWMQEAYIKASNSERYDSFGTSVSLSGDTLAVGAPKEASKATGVNGDPSDNSATDSGAVYIFRRNGTTWAQEAYLKASNTDMLDFFGVSISLSGDTLAVGATQEASKATGINGNQTDNSAPESGAVYLFRRMGNTWAQESYIKASNTDARDHFGMYISLTDDMLAVGASSEDSKATGVNGNQADNSTEASGAAYILH